MKNIGKLSHKVETQRLFVGGLLLRFIGNVNFLEFVLKSSSILCDVLLLNL
jgi:hypothetical protein